MRSVMISVFLASSLGACATVSMVSSEATVETGLAVEQSSLQKVSDAYIDLAERKNWVAKNKGLLGFARVLMDGVSGDEEADGESYAADLQHGEHATQLRDDILSATHGLNVATMEAEKLLGASVSAKALRSDLVSYESALVTAKKARRTFVTVLSEVETGAETPAADALTAFESSIDKASSVADQLADYSAARKKDEATS